MFEKTQSVEGLKSKLYLIGNWLGPRYGLTFKDVADLGYSVMILPEIGFTVMPKALYDVAVEMKKTGTYPDLVAQGKQMAWEEVKELIRLPAVQYLEQTYLPPDVKMLRWRSESLPDASTYYIDNMQGKHRAWGLSSWRNPAS
jgi:hypothetical protein